MNKKISIFSSLLVLLFVGCEKPPKACIEVSTLKATIGTAVDFGSCSEHALSYEWYMEGPEGAPENEKGWSDPAFSNTFTVPGTYTVELNAYENFSFLGEVSKTEQTIVVN